MSAASLPRPQGQVEAAVPDDRLSFALGVFVVLIYSQALIAPLSGEASSPDASPLLRAVYYPAYLATLVLVAGGWRRVLKATISAPLLIAMVILACTSLMWAVDPDATF